MSYEKYFKRLKEVHLKRRLLKSYVETFLAFGLNQLIEKPTKSSLCAVSLFDQKKKLAITASFLMNCQTTSLVTTPGKQKYSNKEA